MNKGQEPRLTGAAKIGGTFGVGFGFFAGAGVTGLSLLIGLLGVWALIWSIFSPQRPLALAIKSSLKRHWPAWLALFACVGWAMWSATWSPAEKLAGETIRRLAAMIVLAPLVVWATGASIGTDPGTPQRAILAGLGIALFILFFESLFGARINQLASPEKEPLAIAGDLGRAATATLSLFWVGFACLKIRQAPATILVGFVAICVIVSLQFGTDLNAVGLVAGTCAALLALVFPRATIAFLSVVCALIMISAPLLYPYVAKMAVALSPSGQLPLSYGRRAQMWNVAADLISQKPVSGWGLGAGSTFDKIVSFGGFDWPIIQLHPHAAPLHIWLETGAIGALLASIALIMAGSAAVSTFGRHKIAAAALVGGLTFLALQWGLSHSAWREWMWTSFAAVIAFSLVLRVAPPADLARDDLDGQ
jgi:O-antigen ligase